MAKQQKLWCEHGKGHWWKRPSQRGKPPKFCPKHKPETVEPTEKKVEYKTLWCEEGEHKWKWKKRGGFEPKNCPDHRPTQKEQQYVELWCQNGKHNWTRERTRGRAPANCPLHRRSGNEASGGLGALKRKKLPEKSAPEPILRGLGKLRAQKRTGLRGLRLKQEQRRIEEAQKYVNIAADRYEAALVREAELFKRLDKLENMKLKTPKTVQKIEELHKEWEAVWRLLNNEYNRTQSAITTHKRLKRNTTASQNGH